MSKKHWNKNTPILERKDLIFDKEMTNNLTRECYQKFAWVQQNEKTNNRKNYVYNAKTNNA